MVFLKQRRYLLSKDESIKRKKKDNIMKNIKKYILRTFAILLFMGASFTVFSQPPPPPGGSSGGGGTNPGDELGGNAPIGGGLFILLGLGAVYGGRKLYQLRKEGLEE